MKTLCIQLCMGSSCFSRGNGRSLEILQEHIQRNELPVEIDLRGSLCEDCCSVGPNIVIDGTRYEQVVPSTILDLLKHHLDMTAS